MSNFNIAHVSTVQMEIPINANGDIATKSEITAGVKKMAIAGISAAASLSQASTVFDTFFGTICNTDFDSLSAKKTTVQGVNI